MARPPALSTDALAALGAGKLARLVMAQADRDDGARRQAEAALAGAAGPEAVAKLIDRRLAGLKRQRRFVEWSETRRLAADLEGIVDAIADELVPLAPAMALDRLLRLVATHERVFERIDDSSGHVQDVYHQAIAAAGEAAQRLPEDEAALLPGRIVDALGESTHGYLVQVAEAVAPHLPIDALVAWDADLAAAIAARRAEEASRPRQGWHDPVTSQWSEMRQIIARARGDLDLLLALEDAKPPHMQDTLGMAERLLDAGRIAEALDWARRSGGRPGPLARDPLAPARVALEARILDALGEGAEAQALRWRCFEAHLDADVLRAHLEGLPDFEDMEAEERALALAADHADADAALSLLMGWPRHDLAARLVVARRDHWSGRDWHTLPRVANELQHEHHLAATILYRALLDDILAGARSKAYGHGARYLSHLTRLAPPADPLRPEGMADHAGYVVGLERAHGRKTGFWRNVRNGPSEAQDAARGQPPSWSRET